MKAECPPVEVHLRVLMCERFWCSLLSAIIMSLLSQNSAKAENTWIYMNVRSLSVFVPLCSPSGAAEKPYTVEDAVSYNELDYLSVRYLRQFSFFFWYLWLCFCCYFPSCIRLLFRSEIIVMFLPVYTVRSVIYVAFDYIYHDLSLRIKCSVKSVDARLWCYLCVS